MTYRKKLIEVALPLKAINEASAREKSIRHGHPSTLHLWWARRPLAACRAVLFASLVDDPDSDPVYSKADGSVDEDAAGIKRADLFNLIEELVQWENSNNPEVIRSARAEIARCVASRKLELGEFKADQELAPGINVKKFIRDCDCQPVFVGTEKSKKKDDKRRFRFGMAHLPTEEVVNAFLAEHAPPVLDPFCGGGSIPLEAQRLGLRAYASDLNPVPVLINKALIETPPKFAGKSPVNPESRKAVKGRKKKELLDTHEWRGAAGLAEDVRYYGKWMRDEAEKRIGHLYPKVKVTAAMAKDRPDLKDYVGQELTVIAWLWARTVASPNPAVGGAHVPLVRSFWLSTKKGKEAWARPVVHADACSWHFAVEVGKPPQGFDPGKGTIGRQGGQCALTGAPMNFPHVRTEGQAQRMSVRLMAIVAEGTRGRIYLSPIESHVTVAESAEPTWRPDATLPNNPRDFKTPNYGMKTFADLFTPRQLTALVTFSDLVGEARAKVLADAQAGGTLPADNRPLDQGGAGPQAYADAIATYLAFSISKLSDRSSNICTWFTERDSTRSTFSRQALPMAWDFAELNTLNAGTGTFEGANEWTAEVIELMPANGFGSVSQLDARSAVRQTNTAPVISTDPPYYDNIGYADLSDFFYVWLRRSLGSVFPTLCSTLLTPKSTELIASPYRHDGSKREAQRYFEQGLGEVFGQIQRCHDSHTPFTVFYAFKQSESSDDDSDDSGGSAVTASTGWETMLGGLIDAGLVISGTWPMRTELANKIGMLSNMLASSIVLSCRPRPSNAPLATRRDFLNSLKRELPLALTHLQQGSIAPVDLAQAAIGPGMAVFTRYSKVMEADGSPMTVRTALGLINQSLDEVLAEQEGEFDADTRWALAWFEQFGMEEGPFGVAETLSKAKNTAVNGLVEAGILHARGGKVRLLKRDELPANWNPATDTRLRHWEVVQHLIRILETEGETAAADLLRQLGGLGEFARDLAYRLYNICERQKWASEALAYNGLVIAWPELTKLALAQRSRPSDAQQTMFTE